MNIVNGVANRIVGFCISIWRLCMSAYVVWLVRSLQFIHIFFLGTLNGKSTSAGLPYWCPISSLYFHYSNWTICIRQHIAMQSSKNTQQCAQLQALIFHWVCINLSYEWKKNAVCFLFFCLTCCLIEWDAHWRWPWASFEWARLKHPTNKMHIDSDDSAMISQRSKATKYSVKCWIFQLICAGWRSNLNTLYFKYFP